MLPLVAIPAPIRTGLAPYREVFCRARGFEHSSRYLTGLILSPNKTLQGMYRLQRWGQESPPSRRAMHAAVFEAPWDTAALLARHRTVIAPDHRGRGREVLSLDWTYAHHDRGPTIWGVKRAWDQVEQRMARYQTVVTAVVANRALVDGVDVVVQSLNVCQEELAYLRETVQESYGQMEEVRGRLLELLPHLVHRRSSKKRTEIAVERAQQLEREGQFPQAH